MHDLEDTIRGRRSARLFLREKPVPAHLVAESLELAVRAPSNSNIQPWHVTFVSGAARDRVSKALLAQADTEAPRVPPLPEEFAPLRIGLGALVYGAMGIARHDTEARRRAVLRNWDFFGAPMAGIVCMHRDLDYVDAVGVGAFLQTLLLALTARGIGSCVQVSVAGYPEVLRAQLGIGEQYRILCGVSIGYPDPAFAANHIDVPRNPLGDNFAFLDQ